MSTITVTIPVAAITERVQTILLGDKYNYGTVLTEAAKQAATECLPQIVAAMTAAMRAEIQSPEFAVKVRQAAADAVCKAVATEAGKLATKKAKAIGETLPFEGDA